MPKRKRVVLSMKDKYEINKRLEVGESATKLSIEYQVGKSTITDIKKQKTSISNFISQLDSSDGSSSRKTMKLAANTNLDDALYKWFTQKRAQGEPISGPILCEKAVKFNEKLEGPSNFQASTGWLKRFKSRHGIRELQLEHDMLNYQQNKLTGSVKRIQMRHNFKHKVEDISRSHLSRDSLLKIRSISKPKKVQEASPLEPLLPSSPEGEPSLCPPPPPSSPDQDTVETKLISLKCDACQEEINGFRYVCVQCSKWQMCPRCETSGVHCHHYILRVPTGRPQVEVQSLLEAIQKQIKSFQDDIAAFQNDREEFGYSVKIENDIIKQEYSVDTSPSIMAESPTLYERQEHTYPLVPTTTQMQEHKDVILNPDSSSLYTHSTSECYVKDETMDPLYIDENITDQLKIYPLKIEPTDMNLQTHPDFNAECNTIDKVDRRKKYFKIKNDDVRLT